jgi:hypothetical protein
MKNPVMKIASPGKGNSFFQRGDAAVKEIAFTLP